MTTVLAAAAAVLFACGTYLLLQRELTRIVLGLALLAHGANLFILLAAGDPADPTFVGEGDDLLDPLPQAFVLTAIVISFAVTTFLLGLAYRSWVLSWDDEVQDDVEDRRVAARVRPAEEESDMAAVEADRRAAAERARRERARAERAEQNRATQERATQERADDERAGQEGAGP